MTGLVLSLFPGGGLFDHAFELEGFTIVRGPDLISGGDIHTFHVPPGRFDGVIGGPPCQAFSPISNVNRARYGPDCVMPDLTPEFERVVAEAEPAWWVMENSQHCPGTAAESYRLDFDNAWLGEAQTRKRAFWSNLQLSRFVEVPALVGIDAGSERAVCSKGGVDWKGSRAREAKRTVESCSVLQGLEPDHFAASPFKVGELMKIIGNGVPIPMGRAIARAVKKALS